MSEQLKSLLPNPWAVDYQEPHDGQGFDLYDEKKMIEYGHRIIRECVDICNRHPSRIAANNWPGESVASDIAHRLSQHFEVKE